MGDLLVILFTIATATTADEPPGNESHDNGRQHDEQNPEKTVMLRVMHDVRANFVMRDFVVMDHGCGRVGRSRLGLRQWDKFHRGLALIMRIARDTAMDCDRGGLITR